MKFLQASLALTLCLVSSLVVDGAKDTKSNNSSSLRRKLAPPDFPPGLVQKFNNLNPTAQAKITATLERINYKRTSDGDYIDFNDDGDVWFVDPPPPTGEFPIPDGPNQEYPIATEFEPSGVPVYHSKPGATYTLYLDFDGHQWVGQQTGGWVASGVSVDAYPYKYNANGDPSFSSADLAVIGNSWAIVAEDFAPFDVDVTTEEPPNLSLQTVGHVLITGSKFDKNGVEIYNCNCGGVAYVGVFPGSSYYTRYTPALVYNTGVSGVAEAISHEFGHNLGLSHDGKDTATYYTGHGSGETDWAPIMGVGYSANTVQWNNGDYDGATQTQDDLAIISNKIGYAADDHPSDTPLVFAGSIGYGEGLIERNTDVDTWTFVLPGPSPVTITVNTRDNRYGNLDAGFTLSDSSGVVIATVAPENTRDASWTGTLSAGSYSIAIEGTGNGANPTVGYSDYGSLGQYEVTADVENLAQCVSVADCNGVPVGSCESVQCTSGLCIVTTDDPCCGDGICSAGEDVSSCFEDCAECTVASECTGTTPGTCETVDCINNECVLVDTVPCCGNDVCEAGEETSCLDCVECLVTADCDSSNLGPCDTLSCVSNVCVTTTDSPCCGDGICDAGENCPSDCCGALKDSCSVDSDCCSNKCRGPNNRKTCK